MVSKDQNLMRELLNAFQAEAPEHVQALNQALLQLERQQGGSQSAAFLQEAFRSAHSLKGAARAVGFACLTAWEARLMSRAASWHSAVESAKPL